MKRKFTAVIAFTALGLTAIGPAQATTFSSLKLIYTAVGVVDNNGLMGTSVMCSNQSGRTARVRWRFVANNGAVKGGPTFTLGNGIVFGVGTANGTGSFLNDVQVSAALNFIGRVAIYSKESAVFCNAIVAHPSASESGNSLHMVRFNRHPGTEE